MALQLVGGPEGSPPPETTALYGIGLLPLAADPDRAITYAHHRGSDALTSDIVNGAYADVLGMMSDHETPPTEHDKRDFIVDTHRAAVERILETEQGRNFSMLQTLVKINPVVWTNQGKYKMTERQRLMVRDDPEVRDRRVERLTQTALFRLGEAGISPPLIVPVEHAPTRDRRVLFIRWLLSGKLPAEQPRLRSV